MKYIYKLTDPDMQTKNGFQWELNKWYETSGEGDLCSEGWLHGYEDPLLAMLHNHIHANIMNPRLFKMEYEGRKKRQGYMKCGVSRARLVEEMEVPVVSTTQRVAYAILCAKEVCDDKDWLQWADNWLSGKDRTEESAYRAAWAAGAAAGAAARAARVNPKINLKKIARKAMKVKEASN